MKHVFISAVSSAKVAQAHSIGTPPPQNDLLLASCGQNSSCRDGTPNAIRHPECCDEESSMHEDAHKGLQRVLSSVQSVRRIADMRMGARHVFGLIVGCMLGRCGVGEIIVSVGVRNYCLVLAAEVAADLLRGSGGS